MKTQEENSPISGPFFSIIVPTYNVSAYIGELIKLIIAQPFRNWELLLIDDCSTDDTRQIISKFLADHRIRLLTTSQNSGNPSIPRRVGLENSRGDYIVTIDADDLIENSLLESMHKILAQGQTDLLIPEMWRFNETSSFKILPKETIENEKIYNGKELIRHTLINWEIPMAGFAVKKEIYSKSYSQLPEKSMGTIMADELLSRYILLNSKRVMLIHDKYFYRINDESITHNVYKTIMGGLIISESLIEFSEREFGKDSEERRKSELQLIFHIISSLGRLNQKSLSAVERKCLIKEIKNYKSGIDILKHKSRISFPYRIIFKSPPLIGKGLMKLIEKKREIMNR